MPGIPVNPTVLKELQRQLNQELSASHDYLSLAVWCANANLKGFARFFKQQAAEEREHADKFMDHLLSRGQLPEIGAVKAPRGEFNSIQEAAKHAQAMEQKNTVGVNSAYEAAVRENDLPAQVMLQWFISEQVEEEDWADEMVDRVQHAQSPGGLAQLDRHIERILREEDN